MKQWAYCNIKMFHLSIILNSDQFTYKQLCAFLRFSQDLLLQSSMMETLEVFFLLLRRLSYFSFSFICSQMGTCLSEAAFEKNLPQLLHSTSLIYSALRRHRNQSRNFTIQTSLRVGFFDCNGSFSIFLIAGRTTSSFSLKLISVELFFRFVSNTGSSFTRTLLHLLTCLLNKNAGSRVEQTGHFFSWLLKSECSFCSNLGCASLGVFLGERSIGWVALHNLR